MRQPSADSVVCLCPEAVPEDGDLLEKDQRLKAVRRSNINFSGHANALPSTSMTLAKSNVVTAYFKRQPHSVA